MSVAPPVSYSKQLQLIESAADLVVSPEVAKALVQEGYKINVERSSARIYRDAEFEAAGATLVPEGTWVDAPRDHIIVGLKELPDSDGE